MKKSERIANFVSELIVPADATLDPCYFGYFKCFNEQKYYEAHEVLEHLWLKTTNDDNLYFKGLIQIAGAFVHLQKQFEGNAHSKDERRLHPACRLFILAMKNLEKYCPRHLDCDILRIHHLCARHVNEITQSDFHFNPWSPASAPLIFLSPSNQDENM